MIIEVALAAKHPPFDSFVGIWGSVIADSLVALGVFGELLFSAMGSKRHGELQRRSKLMVAELNTQAREANARASIANHKAQEAILELVKFRAPRTLTGQQMERTAEKLKQFSGTEYDAAVHSNDPELMGFLYFLDVTLLKAGWKALSWAAPVTMVIRLGGFQTAVEMSVTNMVVAMHPEQESLLRPAAQCLVDELMALGINAMVAPTWISANTTVIHILIGRKL